MLLGLGIFCYIIGDMMDLETKTILYSWFVLIIGVIISISCYSLTKDYINNEEEKISFLYKEFDHLNNFVIDCEIFRNLESFYIKKRKTKYQVTDIIISRPRKIQEDEWEVSIILEPYTVTIHPDDVSLKLLNISDTELDKIMTNNKGLNSLINSVREINEITILNPDVFKKGEN